MGVRDESFEYKPGDGGIQRVGRMLGYQPAKQGKTELYTIVGGQSVRRFPQVRPPVTLRTLCSTAP